MKNSILLALLLTLATIGLARANDPFYLRDGDRVVFFGDSITQGGHYVTYVETYLRTRFPDKKFEVINHGISSETISGTSEPDHNPRRPHAHDRFTRDVTNWKPTVLVACFGMNDGNYHPFDGPRFAKYQEGVHRLIERAQDEAAARLTILTPPPFDPYRAKWSDPEAVHYGYRFPAVNYDDTLARYSEWLTTIDRDDVRVIDVHTAIAEHLKERRKEKVSFHVAPDGVHPNATGHWLMAQALLEGWNAPAEVAVVHINAARGDVKAGDVSKVQPSADGIRFAWRSPLPMPVHRDWDRTSLELSEFNQRLNVYRLLIEGLPEGTYELRADGQVIATIGSDALAAGLDLTTLPELPSNRRAQDILNLVHERRQLVYPAWRKAIAENTKIATSIQNEAAELDARLQQLCQPTTMQIEVLRADE